MFMLICWFAALRNVFHSNDSTLINSRTTKAVPGAVIFCSLCCFQISNKRKLTADSSARLSPPPSRDSLIISFLFDIKPANIMNENTRCSQAYMTYPSWSECWSVRWWRACWDCWGRSVWQEKCLPWHEWLIFWKKRPKKKQTPKELNLWETEPNSCRKTDTSTFTDTNSLL